MWDFPVSSFVIEIRNELMIDTVVRFVTIWGSRIKRLSLNVRKVFHKYNKWKRLNLQWEVLKCLTVIEELRIDSFEYPSTSEENDIFFRCLSNLKSLKVDEGWYEVNYSPFSPIAFGPHMEEFSTGCASTHPAMILSPTLLIKLIAAFRRRKELQTTISKPIVANFPQGNVLLESENRVIRCV
jgi:hypothetical protein